MAKTEAPSAWAERTTTGAPLSQGVPYYVKGLALGVPAYLVAIHMWTWIFAASIFLGGGADFRQFYAAGAIVRTGHAKQLYDYKVQKDFQDNLVSPKAVALPFVSPAYHAVLFAPLSTVSYGTAYLVFLTINLIALVLCFVLLRPWTNYLHSIYKWLPAALFLGFLPIAAALIQGQDSILLTALLAAAFVLLNGGRNVAAGVLLAFALFKFSIILPIAGLFVLWRRWRFVLGFSMSALVLAGLSLWITGWGEAKLYAQTILSIGGLQPAFSRLAQYPVLLERMANLHGLVFGLARGTLGRTSIEVTTILLSLVTFGWTWFAGVRTKNPAKLLLIAIPCSVLVSHHTYIHDLSVLVIPLVILLNSFLPSENSGCSIERFVGRGAALMFVAPVLQWFMPQYFYFVALAVVTLLVTTVTGVLQAKSRGPACLC
jgi:hypothetical protein